jgi:lipopolysaccharide export system protein LptC
MNWRWIGIAALLAAVVIGYGALTGRNRSRIATTTAPVQPGYYLKDAIVTRTQKDGTLAMRLIATDVFQRTSDDSVEMAGVRANYFRTPETEWLVSADHGRVPADSRVVHLEGNVELRPANAPEQSYLRTEALAIDTEKNLAYNERSPATVKFGRHGMQVKSFEADLKSEKIRARSVNGRFEGQ